MINNAIYDDLGDKWYHATDHPIAFLRAEHRTRTPWIHEKIRQAYPKQAAVLDIGCGGGFLCNYLAQKGLLVTGIDISPDALDVAQRFDATKTVCFFQGDALALPFDDGSFDVACALDILEHVESPETLIREASRVLRPGGIFFFHTFNRTLFSYLVAIKGIEWLVANSEKNLHVYSLFLKPREVESFCQEAHLETQEFRGFVPQIWSRPFWKMLFTRKVPESFSFAFSKNLLTGYSGFAIKKR